MEQKQGLRSKQVSFRSGLIQDINDVKPSRTWEGRSLSLTSQHGPTSSPCVTALDDSQSLSSLQVPEMV